MPECGTPKSDRGSAKGRPTGDDLDTLCPGCGASPVAPHPDDEGPFRTLSWSTERLFSRSGPVPLAGVLFAGQLRTTHDRWRSLFSSAPFRFREGLTHRERIRLSYGRLRIVNEAVEAPQALAVDPVELTAIGPTFSQDARGGMVGPRSATGFETMVACATINHSSPWRQPG